MVAVCSDVHHISNGNCIVFDDSFSRFWRYYTFRAFLLDLCIQPYIVLHNLCSLIWAMIISTATLFYMWLFTDMVDGLTWSPWHQCNYKHGHYVCTVRWESVVVVVSMVFSSQTSFYDQCMTSNEHHVLYYFMTLQYVFGNEKSIY